MEEARPETVAVNGATKPNVVKKGFVVGSWRACAQYGHGKEKSKAK